MKPTVYKGGVYAPISHKTAARLATEERVFVLDESGAMVPVVGANMVAVVSNELPNAQFFKLLGTLPETGWVLRLASAQLEITRQFAALSAAVGAAVSTPNAQTISALDQARRDFSDALEAAADYVKNTI